MGALNNDPLGFDMKLGEFLLVIGRSRSIVIVVVVAGIDADFHLRVETSIDFRGGIEAAMLLLLLLAASNNNAAGSRSRSRTGGLWRGGNLGNTGRGC